MGRLIEQKCVMIIAGEASGDLHGAKLVRAMRKKNKTLFFCGIGGQALKAAGVKISVEASELSVVGITEALAKISTLFKGMATAKRLLKGLHPDLLILIDFPDFNLNVAATAKKLKIPVLYYVSPQIWAWRSGRVKKIRKLVDHMAVILPFEEEYYQEHNIPVSFVGHPLMDKDPSLTENPLNKETEDGPVIGLLPGSRDREVARHLPVMLDAARILRTRIKNVKFIVSVAPSLGREQAEGIIQKHGAIDGFDLISDPVARVFERSQFVIVASGTVTLEAAIAGTPMVIIYKVSPISSWFGRAMIRVKNIGLVNLVAGKKIVPELLQGKASPKNISDTVFEMLGDSSCIEKMKKEFLQIRNALGGQGASERTAEIAIGML